MKENDIHFSGLSFSSLRFKFIIQVTHPLCDRNLILARLDAVSEIAESMGLCMGPKLESELATEKHSVAHKQSEIAEVISSVLTMLGKSPDVQRGISRIFHRTSTSAEVVCWFLQLR